MSRPKVRCTICNSPILVREVNPLFEDGVTNIGISRLLKDAGLTVSAEVIGRHRTHYKPFPQREKGERKRDFAALVRNRLNDVVETMEPSELLNKDFAPGLNAGLKAQAIIDNREKAKQKQGTAELAFAIISMLRGEAPEAALALPDGQTIEGTFTEVEADEADEV